MQLQATQNIWIQRWQEYWFAPSPLFDLAICRIVVVLFQVTYFFRYETHAKVLDLSATSEELYDPLPPVRALTFFFGFDNPPPNEFLSLIFWVTLISGLSALVGLQTRLSLIIFAIGNLFIQSFLYSFGEHHHPQGLILITFFLLAFSPAGKVLSADDLIQRLRQNIRRRKFTAFSLVDEYSEFAKWSLRLVQCLLALAYLSAAVSKIAAGGLDWMNGYTLQFYLLADGFLWDRPLGIFLSQNHFLCVIFSWMAIIFEGTFFLVLIFPRLVWLYIPAGTSFHIGIYLAQWAPFFQFVTLYCVFLPWAALVKILSRRLWRYRTDQKPEVLFDGECPLCIGCMTVVCYLDWFQWITYSDLQSRWPELVETHPEISLKACLGEMHLILPNNGVRRGFFAFRNIVCYLPALWPLWPILYFPGMSYLGDRTYRFVAAHRPRFVQSCSSGACSIGTDRDIKRL
ncbi:MAG: DCC1-like thiol-disulfide oxidoreductase family protein [Microcoleaceae cyanobacterium]